jgi:outer membrane protein assembly factor BamB
MSQTPSDWYTFHGDSERSGFVSESGITATNAANLKTLHTLEVGGPILSTPAIVGGFIYVGTANGAQVDGKRSANGGSLHKIDLVNGVIVATFSWLADRAEGDTHGFTGMGCTPTVVEGKVYFSAFNGRLYCLDADTLSQIWITDLRVADLAHNQPVSNISGSPPQAEGWCSPLVVDGKVYVGMGEGENPDLYGFVYCLDAHTGKVIWILCTSQFEAGIDNKPNQLPGDKVKPPVPSGFTVFGQAGGLPPSVVVRGCVVWSGLSYDKGLNQIFCATGNPGPESDWQGNPGPANFGGYAYSVLAIDADSGELKGVVQIPPGSSYRITDNDIDFGSSPAIFTRDGRTTLGIGCKNGAFLLIDAATMTLIKWRQLLPFMNNGDQIPTVDPHGPDDPSNLDPPATNEESNSTYEENFHGTYSTAAVHPGLKRVFIGVGGNNYHFIAAGIDPQSTPFMRAFDWETLDDAWELDAGDPRKYVKPVPPMYTTVGEGGLSSPAVVNDVVLISTTKVSLYAFDANDGTLLWSDDLGMQTSGFNGGYGYCLGPAVYGNYVVAGALILGRDGGVLKI